MGVEEHGTGHVSGLPTVDLGGLDIPRPGNMKYKYDWVPTAIRDTMTPVDAYPPGRFRHQLSGFNPEKIGPNSFHSMNLKYVAARVFEQIDVYDVGALDTAVARLRAQGLDATKVGDDKIDFGDGQGPIDRHPQHVGHAHGSRLALAPRLARLGRVDRPPTRCRYVVSTVGHSTRCLAVPTPDPCAIRMTASYWSRHRSCS